MLYQRFPHIRGRIVTAVSCVALAAAVSSCDHSAEKAEREPDETKATAAAKQHVAAPYQIRDLAPGASLSARLKEEAAAAKELGLRPHVELWADWCEPCVAIHQGMSDPKMQRAFRGTYIIRLDVDRWDGDELKAAGLSAKTIPVFYRLDGTGKPTGDKLDGGAWGENTPKNMAPPLAAFFAPG